MPLVTARHRVRCYPTADQVRQLGIEFEASRVVYNLCIEMARHAHSIGEKYPGVGGFKKAITVWKQQTGWSSATLASVQCLQWAAINADLAFQNFFRRVKQGGTPGFPKVKKAGQTEASATYNIVHCRWNADSGQLVLGKQKTALRLNWDRRGIPLEAKSVTILRDAAGRYFASFTCQREIQPQESNGRVVGLDIGVAHAVTLSTGEHVDLPALLSPGRQRRFVHLCRKLARQERGSKSRERTKLAIARLHTRMADGRQCWQDRVSRELVDGHDLIALEDLNLQGMTRAPKPKADEDTGRYLPNNARAKARLNAAMLNVGAADLRRRIEYKAVWAGRQVKAVHPAYTSQECPACGHVDSENRKTQDKFSCVVCGHTDHADVNAARNILARALAGSLMSAVGGVPAELMRVEGAMLAPAKPESLPQREHNADRYGLALAGNLWPPSGCSLECFPRERG